MSTHPALADSSPATAAPNAATPFRRLLGGMVASNLGAYIALFTPLQILLTLHLTRIAGESAAGSFGLVTGVGALLALIANPLAGRISDRTSARFGRRRTWILTGGIAGSLALCAMIVTTEVWQVALVWCAVQALFNFQLAATSALMADQVPVDRRATASGFLGLTLPLGPLAGLVAVSIIQDPTTQWLIAAGSGIVGAVVAVILIRDPRQKAPDARLDVVELLKSYWLNPRRHPAFGWAFLVRFLISCAYASGTYGGFLLMDRFGVKPEELAPMALLLSVMSIALLAVGSVVSGIISDRIGRQKPFVVFAGATAAVGLVMLAFAPSVPFVYLASAVIGLGTGFFFAIDNALCVRVLPSSANAGKDFALINMANTIPQSFVPFIGPAMLALGGFSALYVLLAAFGLAGALAVLRLPEVGREGDPRYALITKG